VTLVGLSFSHSLSCGNFRDKLSPYLKNIAEKFRPSEVRSVPNVLQRGIIARSWRDSVGDAKFTWEPSVMARIPDEFIGCVFFLYPSRADADSGNELGATGFFVGVDWKSNDHRRHVYAVTNKHCITSCRDTVVIRANRTDGGLEFIEKDPVDWQSSPAHDISVLPISPAKAPLFQNVSDGLFVSPDNFVENEGHPTCLGPGNKVFMIGRFISHDGKTENHPSARFGDISMTAAPIKHPGGYNQESIAVDMRSMSGYSGSPAFVYWEFGGAHLKGVRRTFHKSFLGLLGVDWGHIPLKLRVLDKQGKELADGSYVKSHTSMSGVVPAWRLRELLDSPRFKEQRMQDEKDAAKEPTAETDFAVAKDRPASDENPNVANAAARKRPQGG
jgi:hypothetical protein